MKEAAWWNAVKHRSGQLRQSRKVDAVLGVRQEIKGEEMETGHGAMSKGQTREAMRCEGMVSSGRGWKAKEERTRENEARFGAYLNHLGAAGVLFCEQFRN